jgi:PAS domain S-box-containing protein
MTDRSAVAGLHSAFASLDPEPLLAAPPALIELLPVGVYACDAAGRICWFNAKAAEIWGRSPERGEKAERFRGSHRVYDLDGGLIALSESPIAYALRTGESVGGRTAAVERLDGSRITAMMHITALKDSAGNIVGAINCFHDVTEHLAEDRAARAGERQLREILDAFRSPSTRPTPRAGSLITTRPRSRCRAPAGARRRQMVRHLEALLAGRNAARP